MRSLLILSLILSPLTLATAGCAHDDDVLRRDSKTKVTYDRDGDEKKVTKSEKTVRVDNDVDD